MHDEKQTDDTILAHERDIDVIFITHPHSDHTSGLPALLTVQYDSFRNKPVNVYGPPGTEETVKGRVKNILSKLGANDRTHAAMIGVKRGIIES